MSSQQTEVNTPNGDILVMLLILAVAVIAIAIWALVRSW